MTSTTTEPEPTTEPVEPTTPGDHDKPTANREAASYRRRLRETEAERDALRKRIAGARPGLPERREPGLADLLGKRPDSLAAPRHGSLP